MTSTPALRAEGLRRVYPNGTVGASGVSLSLDGGERVAVLGPNGAGKSTAMNMLAGVDRPTSGVVERREGRVGWCPQRVMVDWSLSVWENVSLVVRLSGIAGSEARSRTQEALEAVGLAEISRSHAETLSGGQLQRVQIARALALPAPLYILDEPTSGLDVEGAEAMLESLHARSAQGAAVLVSYHNLEQAATFASHVLLMHRNELAFFGLREAFLSRLDTVAAVVTWTASHAEEVHATLNKVGVLRNAGDRRVELCVGREAVAGLPDSLPSDCDVSWEAAEPTLREAYLLWTKASADKAGV